MDKTDTIALMAAILFQSEMVWNGESAVRIALEIYEEVAKQTGEDKHASST